MAGALGRVAPPDWKHVEKYPLKGLATVARPKGIPVGAGTNWYPDFDTPQRDSQGHWWIGRDPNFNHAAARGGHAFTLRPIGVNEPIAWWDWHNQVNEGICVSEMVVRVMALINRRRYQPRPVYDVAQTIDEWAGESPAYEGTSCRAGFEVARVQGLVPAKRGQAQKLRKGECADEFDPGEGIVTYRWITSIEDLAETLNLGGRDYAEILNSWGRGYPRKVRVPLTTLDVLWNEDGELGVVTDR